MKTVDEVSLLFKSASEIGLTRRLGEEEYCKNRAQDGAILAVPVWMADRRECSDCLVEMAARIGTPRLRP